MISPLDLECDDLSGSSGIVEEAGQPFLFLNSTAIEGASPRVSCRIILYQSSAEAALSRCQMEQLFFAPNVAKPEASLPPKTRS